ncbi:extracellular solute-binding protein [Actinosynnema pretiosum subsp. pretiosum]|uniref:Extracellular solute-binding protein n=1 Tax=Actinosynnema pretiosum subsp. pretiosum TaxID=103721 RepID=A0AA45L8W9_9PSEU|nr:extracellular solute-binding protein [Actinosynnema pretiosum subsp. pretiosum]
MADLELPDRPRGRRPRRRVLLIALFAVVTAVVASVSAWLAADVDERWRAGDVLHLCATGVMLVLAGVLINLLPGAVKEFWRWSGVFAAVAERVIRALRPLKAVGVVVTVLVLGVGGSLLAPAPDTDATALEEGELWLMAGEDLSPSDPRAVLLEQWSQAHPKTPARLVDAAGATDEQRERVLDDARPDGPHRADVDLLDVVWLPEFAGEGHLRELDGSTIGGGTADFLPVVLDTCQDGGKLWALPLNTDVRLLYHRTDVPGLVVPTSWDGHSGSAATRARGGLEAADAPQLAEEMLTVEALEAIWAAGGNVVTRDGEVTLTPAGSRVQFTEDDYEGMRKLNAMARTEGVVPRGVRPEETGAEDALTLFADGRTAFLRNWAVTHRQLTGRQDRPSTTHVGFDSAVQPAPSVLGGQDLAISRHTAKPKAAKALLEFLTSTQSQQILAEVGGFAPSRTSVYELSDSRHLANVRTALKDARPRPRTERYTEFSKLFREAVEKVVAPEDSIPDETARKLADVLRG